MRGRLALTFLVKVAAFRAQAECLHRPQCIVPISVRGKESNQYLEHLLPPSVALVDTEAGQMQVATNGGTLAVDRCIGPRQRLGRESKALGPPAYVAGYGTCTCLVGLLRR